MDRFNYTYHTLNGEQSNRLNYVTDNGTYKRTTLDEQYIYGSKRVGVFKANKTVYLGGLSLDPIGGSDTKNHELGAKNYELSNHLGNARLTLLKKVDGKYIEIHTFTYGFLKSGGATQLNYFDTIHLRNL